MVKTKSPILSLQASGSIGGVLIAQSWKGRSYIRKLTTPADPQSAKQVGVRAMFSYLTKHWQNILPADQATWDALADDRKISPFDAYIQTNMLRWIQFLMPGEAYPVLEDDTFGATLWDSITNQGRGLLSTSTNLVLNDTQGLTIHRSNTSGFTQSPENAIAIIPIPATGTFTFFDSPLDAGTYYYMVGNFTNHGDKGLPATEKSGTVP